MTSISDLPWWIQKEGGATTLTEGMCFCFELLGTPITWIDTAKKTLQDLSDQELDTNKASGPDGIAAKMLKYTAPVIAPSLTTLFNYSVKNGVAPDEWKNSNILLIPKSSNRALASNYRPISLLSTLYPEQDT